MSLVLSLALAIRPPRVSVVATKLVAEAWLASASRAAPASSGRRVMGGKSCAE
ncbi:hypothetical protein D3C75_1305540 [compost metagenome]